MKRYQKLVAGLVAVGSSVPVFAAIDTTAVTTAMTDVATAALVVGAGFVVMIVATKTFKWLIRAL